MKNHILILIFFLLGVNVFAQNTSTDTIQWTPNYKLKPLDYLGIPENNSKFDAISIIGHLVTSRFITDTTVSFKAYCIFYKRKSWIKDLTDSNLLIKHEQCHFDIAEIFRRKLQSQLRQLEFINFEKNEAFIKKKKEVLLSNISLENKTVDDLYDTQTNYSRNAFKQRLWNEKVSSILNSVEGNIQYDDILSIFEKL